MAEALTRVSLVRVDIGAALGDLEIVLGHDGVQCIGTAAEGFAGITMAMIVYEHLVLFH